MNDEGLIEDKEYNHYEYRKEKLNQFLNDQEEANNQENQIIIQYFCSSKLQILRFLSLVLLFPNLEWDIIVSNHMFNFIPT